MLLPPPLFEPAWQNAQTWAGAIVSREEDLHGYRAAVEGMLREISCKSQALANGRLPGSGRGGWKS
jgi:hypothetical protein